jgi:anti-sigma regulatory factor (Ser/Thr protein kinase)
LTKRRFRPRPESIAAAREAARDALADQPADVVEAAVLMTSELATNCVRHAQTDFELTIVSDGDIRVELRDGSASEPKLLAPTIRQPSGRGLRIVDSMSHRWGITREAKGKTVWFTLVAARDQVVR